MTSMTYQVTGMTCEHCSRAVTSELQDVPGVREVAVALGLLEDHLGHCVAQATAEGGDVAAAKVREASQAIARLVKS